VCFIQTSKFSEIWPTILIQFYAVLQQFKKSYIFTNWSFKHQYAVLMTKYHIPKWIKSSDSWQWSLHTSSAPICKYWMSGWNSTTCFISDVTMGRASGCEGHMELGYASTSRNARHLSCFKTNCNNTYSSLKASSLTQHLCVYSKKHRGLYYTEINILSTGLCENKMPHGYINKYRSNRYTHNNRRTVGNGVFCAVHAKAI
jgi:hypothetical protein